MFLGTFYFLPRSNASSFSVTILKKMFGTQIFQKRPFSPKKMRARQKTGGHELRGLPEIWLWFPPRFPRVSTSKKTKNNCGENFLQEIIPRKFLSVSQISKFLGECAKHCYLPRFAHVRQTQLSTVRQTLFFRFEGVLVIFVRKINIPGLLYMYRGGIPP